MGHGVQADSLVGRGVQDRHQERDRTAGQSPASAIDIDPAVLDRAERAFLRDYTLEEMPVVRTVGCGMLLLGSILHNALIPLGTHPRLGLWGLAVCLAAYSLASWLSLRLWFRSKPLVSLVTILIWLDTVPMMLAVYATGGTASLLYPVFAIRLGDFNQGNFRRLPLVFAHVHIAAYASILAWQKYVDHVAVPWNIEIVTIAVLYLSNLFLTFSAGYAFRLRDRMNAAISLARGRCSSACSASSSSGVPD